MPPEPMCKPSSRLEASSIGRNILIRPGQFRRGEIDFVVMLGQDRLGAQEPQEGEVVFGAVALVILGQGAIDQTVVQDGMAVVLVADADGSVDEAGHRAVVNPALGMGVKGKIIMLPAQPPQQTHGLEFVPRNRSCWNTTLRCGLFSSRSREPAHRTSASMRASGKLARNSWISGVAKRVSPMPASEITRIFMAVQARRARLDSYGRAICSSGAALDSPSTNGMTIPREFTPAFWPQARRVGNEFRQKKLAAAFRHCPWERRHPCRRVAAFRCYLSASKTAPARMPALPGAVPECTTLGHAAQPPTAAG